MELYGYNVDVDEDSDRYFGATIKVTSGAIRDNALFS
jgi:hypothetical protein